MIYLSLQPLYRCETSDNGKVTAVRTIPQQLQSYTDAGMTISSMDEATDALSITATVLPAGSW